MNIKEKFNYKGFDIDKLSERIPIWTVLSFLALVIGYVGFFTFCSKNNIPYIKVDVMTLAAFGSYNLIYWLLIFFAFCSPFKMPVFKAIYIVIILIAIGGDPTLIVGLTLFVVLIQTDLVWDGNKRRNLFKKLRQRKKEASSITKSCKKEKTAEEEKRKERIKDENEEEGLLKFLNDEDQENYQTILHREEFFKNKWLNLLGILIALAVGVFIDKGFMFLILYSYYILYEFGKVAKTRFVKPVHLLFLILFTPAFLSFYLIDNAGYSLAGISKSNVEVITNEEKTINQILVYQNDNNLYLVDRLDSDSTLVIPKGQVKEIKVLDKLPLNFNRKPYIKEFQEMKLKTKD